jgi:hypothetical protein
MATSAALAQTPPASPAPPSSPPPAAPSSEAAYLAKLPMFVQWPSGAFDSPAAPLNICLAGVDPYGPSLDQLVSGQHVGQHPIEVKRLVKVDKNTPCQVLYLGGLKGPAVADAMSAIKGASVLTVTEAERPDDPKGAVDFHVSSGRVHIVVDQDAARRSGLVVSSKLLSLSAADQRRGADD